MFSSSSWCSSVLFTQLSSYMVVLLTFVLSRPGVDFTNILCAAFLYESFAQNFFVLRFKVCTFWRKSRAYNVGEIDSSLFFRSFLSLFLYLSHSTYFFTIFHSFPSYDFYLILLILIVISLSFSFSFWLIVLHFFLSAYQLSPLWMSCEKKSLSTLLGIFLSTHATTLGVNFTDIL